MKGQVKWRERKKSTLSNVFLRLIKEESGEAKKRDWKG
jgi:hypothetical protein